VWQAARGRQRAAAKSSSLRRGPNGDPERDCPDDIGTPLKLLFGLRPPPAEGGFERGDRLRIFALATNTLIKRMTAPIRGGLGGAQHRC